LQDAEAAGVAHRRDEVRAGQVRSHRRGDDGVINPQLVAEVRFHEHLEVSGFPARSASQSRSTVKCPSRIDRPTPNVSTWAPTRSSWGMVRGSFWCFLAGLAAFR